MQARVGEHQPRAFQHALLRALRRGEHLAGQPLAAAVEHDVGEGAADVGGHTHVGAHQLFRSSRAIRNSISAMASFDSLMPGLRCASLAIAPRRFKMYLRTAKPKHSGLLLVAQQWQMPVEQVVRRGALARLDQLDQAAPAFPDRRSRWLAPSAPRSNLVRQEDAAIAAP